jgi:hypothetical protein
VGTDPPDVERPEQGVDPCVDPLDLFAVQQATPDTGLVAHDAGAQSVLA